MPSWEPWDGAERDLAGLREHDADPLRVERIRARCLGALAARRRRDAARRRERTMGWRAWLEPALALGLGAVYLAAAVGSTFAQLREVLR